MRQDESLVVVAVAGLAFVALCTAPSATTALSQFRSRQTKPDAYEDEDGKSTPEAVAAYSAKLPKAAILVLAATGLGTSLALAILSTLHVAEDEWFLENWLLMAVWVRRDSAPACPSWIPGLNQVLTPVRRASSHSKPHASP